MGECLHILVRSFLTSDAMGQALVILLAAASIFSWSIMLNKGTLIFGIRRGCRRFLRNYSSLDSPLAMALTLSEDDDMPLDAVCRTGLQTLREVLLRDGSTAAVDQMERTCVLPRSLSQAELEKIHSSMTREMNIQRDKMEYTMPWLATIITLAPFCGLLGTVWGVLVVFFRMGLSKRPEISEMAPGVSSALLTTVVGLLVAIPAVLGNNLITSGIDKTYTEMETFTEDFIASIRLVERETQSPSH